MKVNSCGVILQEQCLGVPVRTAELRAAWVGFNRSRGSITSSFSIVQVRGYYEVGGLVGVNHGSITYSYATGDVIGSNVVGGVAAWNTGTILASYATRRCVG